MREIKVGNPEQSFDVRPLKRGEVKKLKADGLDINNLTPENADDCLDRVFDMIFDDRDIERIDELPNPDALTIWRAILKESFGSKEEEKNLKRSGVGEQTKSD